MAIIFNNIREKIIESIGLANNQILLMLAWFTDDEIFSAIEKKIIESNVSVKIILSNSEWNLLLHQRFKNLTSNKKFQLRVYGSHAPNINPFLHRKTAIIDNSILLNGSYNWTKNAAKNMEAYTVTTDIDEINDGIEEFYNLWSNSTAFDFQREIEQSLIEQLTTNQDSGITPEMYHSTHLTEVEKIEQPVEKSLIIPEPKYITINTFQDLLTTDQSKSLLYENDLKLWGIESVNHHHTLELKFKIDSRIIGVKIDNDEFIEILKTDKDLFLLWEVLGKKFPIFLLNKHAHEITFLKPLYFTFTNNQLSLTTKVNGLTAVSIRIGWGLEKIIRDNFINGKVTESSYRY